MRVETINGRHLLCGHILREDQIERGQLWASADGSNRTVRVEGVADGWVHYSWVEHGRVVNHEKDCFAFQSRYCLILPGADIPKELL